MSDVALLPPTPAQFRQLEALMAFGAVSLETALGPYDGVECNATLISALSLHGWTISKRLKHGKTGRGGQATVYWLTPAGVDEALLQRIGL